MSRPSAECQVKSQHCQFCKTVEPKSMRLPLRKLEQTVLVFQPVSDVPKLAHHASRTMYEPTAYQYQPPSQDIPKGCVYTFSDNKGTKRTVMLGEVLFRPSRIVGRCSIVLGVRCLCNGDRGCRLKPLAGETAGSSLLRVQL